MNDTFTLWGVQSAKTRKILVVHKTRIQARHDADCWKPNVGVAVVKIECRIVQPKRKTKRGKYPNDNFGLPVETYPAEFEQAFAESKLDAKDKDAAFELWKQGGAR